LRTAIVNVQSSTSHCDNRRRWTRWRSRRRTRQSRTRNPNEFLVWFGPDHWPL